MNPADQPHHRSAGTTRTGQPAPHSRPQGNNVLAYTDRNADNLPDTGQQPGLRARHQASSFDFPLDLTRSARGYQAAAVTNLFYWNNIIHDVLYGYGFDEKSGTSSSTTSTERRQGRRPVRAEAQDGTGRNNANFATPPDGFAPRMQMFEWRDPRTRSPSTGRRHCHVLRPHGRLSVPAWRRPVRSRVSSCRGWTTASGADERRLPDVPYLPDPDGKIPLIDRGTCTFVVKVKNAQNAGAAAAVVANNVAGPPIGMGGADPTDHDPVDHDQPGTTRTP